MRPAGSSCALCIVAVVASFLFLASASSTALAIEIITGGKLGNGPLTQTPIVNAGAKGSTCAYSKAGATINQTKVCHFNAAAVACAECAVKGQAGHGDAARPKAAGDVGKSTSRSTNVGTTAIGVGDFSVHQDGKKVTLGLLCLVTSNAATDPPGTGAALATDPLPQPAGDFRIAPTLDSIYLANQSPYPAGQASLHFDGGIVGQSGPLWQIDLALATGQPPSIAFHSDPSLGLDDAAVLSRLLAALDIYSDSIRMTPAYFDTGYTVFDVTIHSDTAFSYTYQGIGIASSTDPTVDVDFRRPMRPGVVTVSPNPARHEVRIRFDMAQPATCEVSILDVTGRYVRRLRSGWVEKGPNELVWDGRNDAGVEMSAGAYFVVVRDARGSVGRRITMVH